MITVWKLTLTETYNQTTILQNKLRIHRGQSNSQTMKTNQMRFPWTKMMF